MGIKPGKYGIDSVTGYPLCKQGHVLTPDNKARNTCRQCRDAYMNEYRKTDKYKAYWNSDAFKAHRAAYLLSDKRKATAKAIVENLTPAYIAKTLHISVKNLTPELMEIKKLTLQLRRTIKCQEKKKQSQPAD